MRSCDWTRKFVLAFVATKSLKVTKNKTDVKSVSSDAAAEASLISHMKRSLRAFYRTGILCDRGFL